MIRRLLNFLFLPTRPCISKQLLDLLREMSPEQIEAMNDYMEGAGYDDEPFIVEVNGKTYGLKVGGNFKSRSY